MLETAKIFSEGMILQREKPIAVWGCAEAGMEVRLSIQGQETTVIAGEDGRWQAELPPLKASEQEMLTVKTDTEEICIKDVAVGEVWIAGGQSNMEFPLRYEKYREEELHTVNGNLRFYDVPEICYQGQDTDFDYSKVGVWRKAQGDDLGYFSAVGYYFQKELEADLAVPVGIIGCNWGGTRSCAWMKEETVKRVGEPWIKLYEDSIKDLDIEKFWQEQRVNPMNDRGNPNNDPFNELVLTGTPSMRENIAMFAQASGQTGGDESGGNMGDIAEDIAAFRNFVEPKTRPGCLYEHMVQKTAPYTVRGFLWYQGENDDMPGLQSLYADMLEGLIADWRQAWKDETLPFLIVQLPGWRSWMMLENLDYTTIRSCQEDVANRVNDVYLASISDVGEELDIHPKDKKTVGHRLALLARNHVYGEDILCEAPAADRVERDGSKIVITFRNAGAGLKATGDKVEALAVVKDGEEIAYSASVHGNRLEILPKPVDGAEGAVTVEFAQGAWYRVNLCNEADIPAIPFCIKC